MSSAPIFTLETERLLLRPWRTSDRIAFAAMNADSRVMEFLPSVLSRDKSDRLADHIEEHFQRHGYGPWAAELRSDGSFIGYIGLNVPPFEAHFTPCVEIGWRLSFECWGKGLATEGARRALRYGFETLGLEEVVSFTVPANVRSRRVMEKLGMTHGDADDFDHPGLAAGHPLRHHVLYRLKRTDYASGS